MPQAVVVGIAAGIATGSVIVGIAVAVTSLVLSEMLQPDIPTIPDFRADFNPTGHLANTKSTDAPLPIVYGKTKVGGGQVYISTSGTDNKYLHIVQTISEGEIESLEQLFFNDKDAATEFAGKYTVNFHSGSATQTYDADLHNVDPNWVDCLRYTAYMYLRLTYDREKFTSIPKITAIVKGRKVYDPRDDTIKWTDNPALCIYDFMINKRYGVGLNSALVDLDSVKAAADWCDNIGFTFNGVINTKQAAIDNLTNMLATARMQVVFNGGVFKLIPLQYDSPVMKLTEEDLIEKSFSKIYPTVQDLPNTLKVRWINPNNYYIYDDLILYNKAQIDADGERIEKSFLLLGCDNLKQARTVGSYQLERIRRNRRYNFTATHKALPLEAGDMITIDFPSFGVNNEIVRIESIVPLENDTFKITVIEESADLYDTKTDLVTQVSYGTNLPDGLEKPSTPSNLSLTTGVESNQSGLVTAYIIAIWDQHPSPKVIEYELKIRENGSTNYTYVKLGVSETSYKFGSLKPGTIYYVAIRAISENSLVSDWSTEQSITTAIDNLAPSAPAGVFVESNFKTIYVRWSPNSEPDVAGYEVYASQTSGFTCDDNTLVWRGSATKCSFLANNEGTWYIKVKAYDITGNISDCSAEVSINVNDIVLDSTPEGYNLIINSDFDDGGAGWVKYKGSDIEIVTAINPKTGSKAAQNVDNTQDCWYYSETPIPIQKDRTYIVEGYFKQISGDTGVAILAVKLMDKDGNNISGDGTWWYYPATIDNPTEFTYYHGVFGFNSDKPFPDNATHMQLGFILNYDSGGNQNKVYQVQGLRIREVIESAYIRDAAITTAKIADLAVDDAKINRVKGNKIYAGQIFDYYGNQGDYVTKIDLDDGSICIRDGIFAPNIVQNYDFSQGTVEWIFSAGEVLQNSGDNYIEELPAKQYFRLPITDDKNEHLEWDPEEAVAEGESVWFSWWLKAVPDQNIANYEEAIGELADLRIYANWYNDTDGWIGWEEIWVLDKRDWLDARVFNTEYTIPEGQNIQYIDFGFETQGVDDKWNDYWLVDNPEFNQGTSGWEFSDTTNIVILDCYEAPDGDWSCNEQAAVVKMLVDGTSREVVDADFIDISGREGEDISAAVNIICDNPSTTDAIELGVKYYDSNQNFVSESVLWTGSPSSWVRVCGWDTGCDNNAIGQIPSGVSYVKVFIRAKSISTDYFYCYFSWLDVSVEKHATGDWAIALVNFKHGYALGDEAVLTSGDISFYKYRDESGTPFKSLKKIETGVTDNGTLVYLDGFYDRMPEILVSPYDLQIYSANYSSQNQIMHCYAKDLSGDTWTGEWTFRAVVEQYITSSYDNYVDFTYFIDKDDYKSNTDKNSTVYNFWVKTPDMSISLNSSDVILDSSIKIECGLYTSKHKSQTLPSKSIPAYLELVGIDNNNTEYIIFSKQFTIKRTIVYTQSVKRTIKNQKYYYKGIITTSNVNVSADCIKTFFRIRCEVPDYNLKTQHMIDVKLDNPKITIPIRYYNTPDLTEPIYLYFNAKMYDTSLKISRGSATKLYDGKVSWIAIG